MYTNEDLIKLRHSTEHVAQTAIRKIFPDIKNVVGPAIENGFFFDFATSEKITPELFPRIETEMQKIIDADLPITCKEISYEEAKQLFVDNPYKQEKIEEIKTSAEPFIVYEIGTAESEYYNVDLCAGPHLESTGQIKAFKLLSVAGAYYKGSEENEMLTRIYGTAFYSKEELDNYLRLLEEAKARDHRKLGAELDLFVFSELVGPGLPLFTPKGTVIKEELQKYVEKICRTYGFDKVITPHLAKIELYELSGHAKKFADELFHVTSIKGHEFVMKPVQCPHQTQIYASRPRSYRELPIRYMESEKQYRAEKPGEVSGLSRVYAITVEDGHSFCTVDQVRDEVKGMVNIIKEFYSVLGLWGNHWVSLSVRDYKHPEKYIGEPEDWNVCEKMLQEVSDEMGLDAIRKEGEAALYGPKLDFMFKDALGKEIQIPTVQLDFATPKRFELNYIDSSGEKQYPVMVHRAILGSYERFMALIIEHFAGAFPVWLAPVQVEIIPISETQMEYAQEVKKILLASDLRAEIDTKDATMQSKIRDAQLLKIPYMVIVGDKEKQNNTVSVRLRDGTQQNNVTLAEFVDRINNIYLTKSLGLW